jgi:UDP-glucuronate 4-epimerase
VILHLAAQVGVRYRLENPKAYIDSNLTGSWNILELARQMNPSISFGPRRARFMERMTLRRNRPADQPLSVYEATKKAMELMAYAYAHLHPVPITAFRFLRSMAPGPFDIYGEGRLERDFTCVDDLIEAVMRLIAIPPGIPLLVPSISAAASRSVSGRSSKPLRPP